MTKRKNQKGNKLFVEQGLCAKCGLNPIYYIKNHCKWCRACHTEQRQQYHMKNKARENENSRRWMRDKKPLRDRFTTIEIQFNILKQAALRRNKEFELSINEVKILFDGNCFYCDSSEKIGIDRIDNSKGYIQGNVVSCCKWCNFAKHTQSLSDFYIWIDKIATHNGYTKLG